MGVRSYCISDCDTSDKSILLEALFKRSKMTWKDIKDDGHFKLGYEILSDEKLNKKLREKSLKKLSDDARLKVFRAKQGTKKRIIGHREDHIFYLLYYDRKGDLYNHN